MFAPPICRRRWRNNAFRSVSSDEDGGNPANIAASSSEQSNTARLREQLNQMGVITGVRAAVESSTSATPAN